METTNMHPDLSQLNRIIGQYPPENPTLPGPCLLVSAGIHGNEPSGILALQRVFQKLDDMKPDLKGMLVGLAGNMEALKKGTRLIEKDLNRICTLEFAEQLKSGKALGFQEGLEFHDLVSVVDGLEQHPSQFGIFFMDLHTTSSKTVPYISVNKKTRNFDFAKKFPLPIVRGIEEFIPGHFDHFLTLRGYTGLTLDAGQLGDPRSVDYHEAAIWLALVDCGMIDKEAIDYRHYYELLKNSSPAQERFEVIDRFELEDGSVFSMNPGFENFDMIQKGQHLANLNGDEVLAAAEGRIFLPLYQIGRAHV